MKYAQSIIRKIFELKKFQFIILDKKQNVSIMAVDFDVAEIEILSLADYNEIKLKINLKPAPKPLNDDIISCITKS